MNIIDKLKVLTGRKLSAKQLERAKSEQEIYVSWIGILEEDYEGDIDNFFVDENGQFLRKRINYTLATTPDASEGWLEPHTQYYETKRELRKYNEQGELVERTIEHTVPCGHTISSKKLKYEPAGRFFGKRIKK